MGVSMLTLLFLSHFVMAVQTATPPLPTIPRAAPDAGNQLSLQPPDAFGSGVREFIKHSPAFSLLTVKLDAGSTVKAEAGSLVAMQDVDIHTEWSSTQGQGMFGSCLGPFLSSLTRTVGGMSLCQNLYTGGDSGKGDIVVHHLNPQSDLFIQPGSFLGCWPNIETTLATKGFKAMLSGEGPIFVRAAGGLHGGKGQVYLASYGAIEKLLVKDDSRVTVDSGHIVAYEESLTFSIGMAGQFLLGGEGFVCNFRVKEGAAHSEGIIYVQTRDRPAARNDH